MLTERGYGGSDFRRPAGMHAQLCRAEGARLKGGNGRFISRRRGPVGNAVYMITDARILLLAVAALVVGGCAGVAPERSFVPSPAEANLVESMAKRLDLSREVAWAKYQDRLPVRDPVREAELLASVVEQGGRMGLPAGTVEDFFGAQMGASRLLQAELTRGWSRGAELPAFPPRSLRSDLRPRLDALNAELLRELARLGDGMARPGFAGYARVVLEGRGFSWRVARTAVVPLLKSSNHGRTQL